MTRTKVRWFRAACLTVLVMASLASAAARAGAGAPPSRPGAPRIYVVKEGDTLWGIASSLVGRAGDPRPAVDRLVRMNGIRGGLIFPGQALRLSP